MGDLNSLIQSGTLFLTALIACLVALPFVVIALVFFFISRRNSQQAQASLSWPSVPGTVGAASVRTSTSTTSEGGSSTSYYPELLYEYEVQSHRYIGQRITFGSQVGYGDSNRAQAIVDRYVPGNQVRVYYDPANPGDAVLERAAGTSSRVLIWVALLILIIVCVTIVPMLVLMGGLSALFSALPFSQ